MSNPYRDALAELYDWAKRTSSHYYVAPDVMDRAQALLSQPEPPELTDEDLHQMLFDNHRGAIEFLCDAEEEAHLMIRNHVKFARAAIAADRTRRA